jgi:hypothetical protein
VRRAGSIIHHAADEIGPVRWLAVHAILSERCLRFILLAGTKAVSFIHHSARVSFFIFLTHARRDYVLLRFVPLSSLSHAHLSPQSIIVFGLEREYFKQTRRAEPKFTSSLFFSLARPPARQIISFRPR